MGALNDKFNKITKAVNGMEREMNVLRKAKKESDDECKKVNRFLGIREKEVNVLVARCAAQEEKLNDMKSSRVLEKELNAVKKSKEKQMEDHGKEIKGLMGDLQQVGNQKQALQGEIKTLGEKMAALQQELDASRMEVQEKRDKINHLYDELKELHESKEKESTECIAMRKNLQDIKNDIFNRETQIDDLQTRHKNEMIRMRNELEDQRKNNEHNMDALSSSKDREIETMKEHLESKQANLDNAVAEMKHWRFEHEKTEKELHALEMELSQLSQITKEEAVAMENERVSLDNRLSEKNGEVDDLNKIIRDLKDENESNSMQMTKLKEKLGFLENEIRVMTEKEMDLFETQNQKMDTIFKLEQEVRKINEDKDKMKKSYKEKIEDLESEAIEMQEEMENIIQENDAKVTEVNHELGIERSKAENYWAELEQLRSKTSKQEELRQIEIDLLEESVKAAKAQSKSREEEFNKMKDGDLRLTKKKVIELEEKCSQMEKICEQTEMDAAIIVDDLNKKLVEAAEKHARVEEEKRTVMTESRSAIQGLERKISTLETKFSNLQKETELRSEQLNERDATIASLTKSKKAQEESVESWKNDLDMLIAAYEKCKTDHAATVKKLQNDYDEFKKKAQHDAAVFENDYESLQRLAAETETKFEQQNDMLTKTKEALDDRTRVLGEMVECQKATEKELKEARDMIAELQDISESYSKQNEEYQSRYQSLKVQMEKDRNHHLDEIQSGDDTRKELERKIKKLEADVVQLREEVGTTAELRAANYLLQDKVDRQEAFMKRKLEKEKKQRMIPHSMSSPPRLNPPRSRSVSRRPTDPQKKSKVQKPRSRSQSINRKAPTPDDELEELLS